MKASSSLSRGPLWQALLAAALFGMSAPLAKLLLGEIDAIPLAALLYLGAGLGLLAFRGVERLVFPHRRREAGLDRRDFVRLAGAIVAGGVAAPLLLLFGLRETDASTASLLLNFEAAATAALAAGLFRESVGRRTWAAILVLTLGSALLSLSPSLGWTPSVGALLVLAACAAWGLDNNLTREVALKDPREIVIAKGLIGGGVSLCLALALRRPLPGPAVLLLALLLGGLSYGASIALYVHALRGLGAARSGAVFGTAPFIGAALSFALFPESPQASFFVALGLLLVGAALLFSERHVHAHVHEAVTHAHSHRHDDGHHGHAHDALPEEGGEHAHPHAHPPLTHAHPHRPDAHHRHAHGPTPHP